LILLVRPAEGQDPNIFSGDTFNLSAPSTGVLTLLPPDPSGATYALPFAKLTLPSTKPFGAWTFTTTDVDPSTLADVLLVLRYTLS